MTLRAVTVLAALLAALLAACAAQQPATRGAVASAGPGGRVVCHTERPTGSNIPETVCRSAEDREAEGDAARRAVEDLTRQRTQRSAN